MYSNPVKWHVKCHILVLRAGWLLLAKVMLVVVLLVVVLLIMGLLVRAVDTRSPSFTPSPPTPNETRWIPLEGAAANQAQESRQGGRGGGRRQNILSWQLNRPRASTE